MMMNGGIYTGNKKKNKSNKRKIRSFLVIVVIVSMTNLKKRLKAICKK
jgi:hypothetical protein